MWLVKWVSLGGSPGLHVPDGHGAKGFSFLDGVGTGGFSFLDGCRTEILASWVEQAQMALASLMDSDVLESFRWRSMPSSQTNFCQRALIDDLVASSPPRALLASSQRWFASAGRALLLGPGVSAVGEGAVGISSREASAILASSGVLTWDDVSTGPERSPSLLGRSVSTTMGFSLFGVEFSDKCPDVSNPTQIGAPSLPWSCWPLFPPLAE